MLEVSVAGSSLDTCDQCGGAWIDFFDGEFAEIARLAVIREDVQSTPDHTLSCVDCPVTLERQPYLSTGPEILRCPQCMGGFLSTNDIQKLSRFHDQTGMEKPSWWSKFWTWAHN